MSRFLKQRRKGFTLAEVLVTLAVIGVVASLTIPSIVKNSQNAEFATKAKAAFSLISQATKSIIAEDSVTIGECFDDSLHATANGGAELFCYANYLKIAKNCGHFDTGCFYNDGTAGSYKFLSGEDYGNIDTSSSRWTAILVNGMSIGVYTDDSYCNTDRGGGPLDNATCGFIEVDTNGAKGPNVLGKDLVYMRITKSGTVVPGGSAYNDAAWSGGSNSVGSIFTISCNSDGTNSGYGCLGRILQEGSIEY